MIYVCIKYNGFIYIYFNKGACALNAMANNKGCEFSLICIYNFVLLFVVAIICNFKYETDVLMRPWMSICIAKVYSDETVRWRFVFFYDLLNFSFPLGSRNHIWEF